MKLLEELIERDLSVIVCPFDLNTFIDSGIFLNNYLAATEDLRIANCQSLFENLKVDFSSIFSKNKSLCMIVAYKASVPA